MRITCKVPFRLNLEAGWSKTKDVKDVYSIQNVKKPFRPVTRLLILTMFKAKQYSYVGSEDYAN